MDKIIVYLDDADHALQQLVPMKNVAQPNAEMQTTQWVLVACAPRMTRHISKWVSWAPASSSFQSGMRHPSPPPFQFPSTAGSHTRFP